MTQASNASGADSWREQVLHVALRAGAVLVPVVVALFIATRNARPFDGATLVLCAIALLAVVLGVRPTGFPFRARAALLIGLLQVGSVAALCSGGLLPGPALGSLCAVVLCGIFFGRRAMFLYMLVIPLSYATVGALVTNGLWQLRLDDADPMIYRHWLRASGTTVLLAAMLGIAVEFVVRHVETSYRTALQSADALRTTYDQLGMLHRKLELTKEEERASLARELHDEMGQMLTALKLRLQMLFRGQSGDKRAQGDELLGMVDDLIGRVRRMSLDLRPTLLDEMGLEPALSAFVDTQAKHSGVLIGLQVRGLKRRLSPELEQAAFRIVQEATTNALRHAAATRIEILIGCDDDELELEVRDDGRGFSASEANAKAAAGHLGVVGMRERVRLLGGEFTVRAASDRQPPGTRVHARLPVP